MARVKVKQYEDASATLYFVKSKSLTDALNRATLLAQVLPVDKVTHIAPEAGKKKHTLVLTIFTWSAMIDQDK